MAEIEELEEFEEDSEEDDLENEQVKQVIPKQPYQYSKSAKDDRVKQMPRAKQNVAEKMADLYASEPKEEIVKQLKAEEPKYVAVPRVVSIEEMLNIIFEDIQVIKQFLAEKLK